MENEENRGLINKNPFEDQWARVGQFSFGALSLFSLSLILLETYIFLGALLEGVPYLDSWINKVNEKQEITRGNQGE